MNNLGTKEQGTKVWNNILRKLDNSPKTTGITIKAPEFYNLSAYFRKVHPGKGVGVANGEVNFSSNGRYGLIMCIYHCLPLLDYTTDMLDPEKIVGSAQSGKAMEVLHGPLVELVNEIRPWVEDSIVSLITKISFVTLKLAAEGSPIPISIPPEWNGPLSLDIVVSWPPVFPMTMEDLRSKVQIAVQAANASLISRETMTRWLAKDFGIEDVEQEIAKIDGQKILNPFGAF